jgi:hypothetical protein
MRDVVIDIGRRSRFFGLIISLLLALVAYPTELAGGATLGNPSAVQIQSATGLIDPNCNGGHGFHFEANDTPYVTPTVVSDGDTILSVSNGYPESSRFTLYWLTNQCQLDKTFGNAGEAMIKLPGIAKDPGTIQGIAPGLNGDVIVAGSAGTTKHPMSGTWIVGEVNSKGHLVGSFGQKGWAHVSLPGQVTALTQEASGRILAGGTNGGGCCVMEWLAALTPKGELDRAFANQGYVSIPPGEDSELSSVLVEPGGNVLAVTGYGNMGCWGDGVSVLSPAGKPLSSFSQIPVGQTPLAQLHGFVGDVAVTSSGFELIGVGQASCVDGQVDPTTGGYTLNFTSTGSDESSTSAPVTPSFPSPMLSSATVVSGPSGDHFLIGAVDTTDSTDVGPLTGAVYAIEPSGLLDRSFPGSGSQTFTVRLEGSAERYAALSAIAGRGNTAIVIGGNELGGEFELVRLVL